MPEVNKISQSAIIELLAHELGVEAFVFGYPLVLMDVTRSVFETSKPINQLRHMRTFPDDTFTDVVNPNADMLCSTGFLDLRREPIVLTVPEISDRYYLMQLLDGWTNVFASLGTRTTGTKRKHFAIIGPGWRGKLPDKVTVIKSPTNLVGIIGRTQTNGIADYAAVHAIQNQYQLTPLHAFGYPHNGPSAFLVDSQTAAQTPPVEQVARMEPTLFLNRLSGLMRNNPPADDDAQIMRGLISIGLFPGKSVKLKTLNPAIARGIDSGCRAGLQKIIEEARAPHGRRVNGWEFIEDLGRYGTRYLWRAVVAMTGLGPNLPEDAVYGCTAVDGEGKPLHGRNRYIIHFTSGQLPPVNAFWSLTMYNQKQFFVPNPVRRYALSDRSDLKFNGDGSLTLFVQNERPTPENESNWLPAPPESFNIMMRLYWPKKEIIAGTWIPPRVDEIAADAEKAA